MEYQIRFINSEYDKPIDILSKNRASLSFDVDKLLIEKFNKNNHDDNIQLQMILFNRSQGSAKSLKEIQDYYANNAPKHS